MDIPARDPIVEDVVALLRRRSALGQAKYSTTLDSLSLRAALQHRLEELLDDANYTMAAIRRLDAGVAVSTRDAWGDAPLGRSSGWSECG